MTRSEGEPAEDPETTREAQTTISESTQAVPTVRQDGDRRDGLDEFLDVLDSPVFRERRRDIREWVREVVLPLVLEELEADPRFRTLQALSDSNLAARQPESDLTSDVPAVELTARTERERVRLSGRAGADPSFRTTRKGTLIGRFPLAVHETENATTWYPVLAFNQRAEQLRDVVKKGAALDIVGYLHTREVSSRDGTTRTVQEIYAVSVKPAGTNRRGAR